MATNLPNPNDVSPTTSHDLRCPQCSAHVSPAADWCTLCFADLRAPAPVEAQPEVEPAVELAPAPEQPPGQPAGEPEPRVGRGSGKHARAATSYDDVLRAEKAAPRDAATTAEIEARADEMLAMLAADRPKNPLGPLAERLATTHSRIAAGLMGLVVVSLVGWLVMTVLGHLV